MRILAAGDIHGDSSLAKKLAERAKKEKADLVILCGDITDSFQKTEGLIGPFLKKNKKVLLIPGNHDGFATVDFLAELYGVKNIHGYSVKYEDVGIFGCGGANIGLERLQENEIYSVLKRGFDKIKNLKKKIMVTHVPPSNTLMEKFVPGAGSKGVKEAVKKFKPDILLCSHLHEAEGIEEKLGKTKIINVGKKGKMIEV